MLGYMHVRALMPPDTCDVNAHTCTDKLKKKSCRPAGAVSVTSSVGLAATKPQVDGGKDYRSEFQAKNGTTAMALVEKLSQRHVLLNPGLHPTEPFMETFEEVWCPLKTSRDPVGENLVKELAAELRAKGSVFEDPIFPADTASLFADPQLAERNMNAAQTFRKDQDAFLAGVTGIQWKRPKEWGDASAKVVMFSGKGSGLDPDDVAQGRLGNCYFLAAIAGCAASADTEDILIRDLCIEDHADVGLYGVKFFINGKWATVIVDDRIPCVDEGNGWYPIFASPKEHSGQKTGEKELWPMIFEKAWAKLNLSYEATAGGLTQDAASYLSGGLTKCLDLERGDENDAVWAECKSILNPPTGKSFAFLSCAVRPDEDPSNLGLITGHAYSILKMVQTKCGKRLVQIRNPWGQHEWTGRYSDKSDMWTPELCKEVGHENEEDGSFFMLWEDFVQWFEGVEVCDPIVLANFTEGDLCRVDGLLSHWVKGKTAGGDVFCQTFKYNPTCKMTVTKDCDVAITLFQPDVRPMFHPDEEDLTNKLATVYVSGGDRQAPEQVVVCRPKDVWAGDRGNAK
jgi:hypothetical protein